MPDMPALFGTVMALVDERAAMESADITARTLPADIEAILWRTFRRVRPSLPDEPPQAWSDALQAVLALNTPPLPAGPTSTAPIDGERSAAYADDAHSSGWVPKALYKALLRIIIARDTATLTVNQAKCAVLVPAELVPFMKDIVEPLRVVPGSWKVVTHLRVLGVMLAEPTRDVKKLEPVRQCLDARVQTPDDQAK